MNPRANPDDVAAAKAAGALCGSFACMAPILLFALVLIAAMWKIFEKAGQPGWAAIVPFYNVYILTCKVAKKDVLWFILSFVPFVNIVISFLVSLELAKKFGRSEAFGLGLFFLGFIFYPILAFGDSQYEGHRRKRSLSRRQYDEDDEYDDADDEDDDYDDRPRRRRAEVDDEDDDDEYDDRPRRRPRR